MRPFFLHVMRHQRGHDHHARSERHCHPEGRHGMRGHHRPGGRFGGPDHDDSSIFRGRRFSSDDLQLLLLFRLAQGRSHGYQLIKTLAEMSQGVYSPSPGMVYPALTYLEEIGYADVELESNKKLYSLSESGRAYLAEQKARVDELVGMFAFMSRRARAMRGEETDAVPEDDSPLAQARSALKAAMRAALNPPGADVGRIAEILKRAAAEIANLKK